MKLHHWLCHWLFGWHYVHLRFGAFHKVRRVRFLRDGRAYVVMYGGGDLLFLTGPKSEVWHITPLTFSPEGTPFETRETA